VNDAADGIRGVTLSHIGLCVSDVDRATAFYVDGLGFEVTADHAVGAEFGPLMEVDSPDLRSRFIARDGMSIELLQFVEPGHLGDGTRREVNRLGFTHMCLNVTDVDAVADRIVAAGGTVLDGTWTRLPMGDAELRFVYCTDPDGTRIELMQLG
jgi:catechol 2,3-dioxygenase-like lactoylglutathione lyase family enzyme